MKYKIIQLVLTILSLLAMISIMIFAYVNSYETRTKPLIKAAHSRQIQMYDLEGTGTYISNDGYILTNLHVVLDEGKLSKYYYQIIYKGQIYEARVVYLDNMTDLAILKIKGKFNIVSSKIDFIVDKTPCLAVVSHTMKKNEMLRFVLFDSDKNKTVMFTTLSLYSVTIFQVNDLIDHEILGHQFSDLSAPYYANPGNSGSPLLDSNNNIVGVLWGSNRYSNSSVSNSLVTSFLNKSHLPISCSVDNTQSPINSVVQVVGTFIGPYPPKD